MSRQLGLLLILLLALTSGQALLAQGTWRIGGLDLNVEPARVIAVKDIPLVVGYRLNAFDLGADQPQLPSDWRMRCTYNPPNGAAPVSKDVALNWQGTLTFNAGPEEGMGSINAWQIVDGQDRLIRAFDHDIVAQVLGDVIVPQVDIKRLSYSELQELGVVLGDDNIHGIEVKLKANINKSTEFLDTELVLIKDEVTGAWTPIDKGGRRLQFAQVSIGVSAEDIPELPVMSSAGVPQEPTPEQAIPRPRREVPKIDAVLVFPANVGYLNSFFKPTLILLNVAPEETNYVVRNLQTSVNFPDGALRLAQIGDQPQQAVSEPLGPGPDGINGNEDDINTVEPQQKAYTSWVLEGMKPGEHKLDFEIRGTLQAEDGLSYPIRGAAEGYIYVRRPNLSLHFNFPSVIRENDDFEIEAVFTLTNDVEVQDLRFDMAGASVLGADIHSTIPYIDGEPVQDVVILSERGDQVTFILDCTALTTGSISVYDVTSDDNTLTPSYSVNVAVGEHGLPVSAVSLLMPKALRDFPITYDFDDQAFDLIKVIGGRALSLAAVPPGREENGLPHVPNTAVRDWIQDLTLAALKPRSGTLAEQRDLLVRDFFLASLAQEPGLVTFFAQDSKFAEWSSLLASHADGVDNMPAKDLLVDRGALLMEGQVSGGLPWHDSASNTPWSGFYFGQAFTDIELQHDGDRLRGLFYNGNRWGRWSVENLEAGQVFLLWNGSELQVIQNNQRIAPTWQYETPLAARLLAVRQMGPETTGGDDLDPYGRQLLLYFSEPVNVDADFLGAFQIERNYLLKARKMRSRIIQVWARNPLGLRERDLMLEEGVVSQRGQPIAPATMPIHMSENWDGITLSGRVFGPEAQPLQDTVISLVHGYVHQQSSQKVNFLGYDELVNGNFGDFADDIKSTLERNLDEVQTASTYRQMTLDFVTLTNGDGYYEMDFFPFFRSHDRDFGTRGCFDEWDTNCMYLDPDLLWSVSYGDRRVDRRIYGRYPGQDLVYDFVFPALGSIHVAIPPLDGGVAPRPDQLVKVQIVDLDERVVDRVLLPGETIKVDGLRRGPISVLARGIGGFDARSVSLTPETEGQIVTLSPSVEMATLTAEMMRIDEYGVERPIEYGALLVYHHGPSFGGTAGQPRLLGGATLGTDETEDGFVSTQLPEGLVTLVYARQRQGNITWKTMEVVAGQTHHAGKFVLGTEQRGEVRVRVIDELGIAKTDWPVLLVDGLSGSIQNTDASGETLFENILIGRGKVQTYIRQNQLTTQEFTLTLDQRSTLVEIVVPIDFQLTVEVRDTDGSLLPNAWVETGGVNEQSGYTNAQGQITFNLGHTGPSFGDSLTLRAQHPQSLRFTNGIYVRPFPSDPDDPSTYVIHDTTSISFEPTGSMDLTIVGSDTLAPLEGVWVELTDADHFTYANTTDAEGKVSFANLVEGDATIILKPSVALNESYLETLQSLTVIAGEHLDQALQMEAREVVDDSTRTLVLTGDVRDFNLAALPGAEVNMRYTVPGACPGNGEESCWQEIGTAFSNDQGLFEMELTFPINLEVIYIAGTVSHAETGTYGTGNVIWKNRTSEIYIPFTLNTRASTRIRVWDELGRRLTHGVVTVTQRDPVTEEIARQQIELSETAFEPEVTVFTDTCFEMVYESNGARTRLNTSIYANEDGRPQDLVVKPTGTLSIAVADDNAQSLTQGIFVQVFHSGRIWTERYFTPQAPEQYMHFEDMPFGDYSVLALDIRSGITDIWYGELLSEQQNVQLVMQPGEDLRGKVQNDDGSAVPFAQLILSRKAGTLAFSNSQTDGISRQKLLARADENGDFTYPALPRGSYHIQIYDPSTDRRKNISVDLPETNDIDIVLNPIGYIDLAAILDSDAPAVGGVVKVFRNGRFLFSNRLDGDTGSWSSGPLPAGALTLLVTDINGTQKALLNTEIMSQQTTTEVLRLQPMPNTPMWGFEWDDGEIIDERIVLHWEWRAPGGLARESGTTIYPDGSAIRHRFLDGELRFRANFSRTLEHRAFAKNGRIQLNESDDLICSVTRPRTLEVEVLDQFTREPFAGTQVSGTIGSARTDANGIATFQNVTIDDLVTLRAVSFDELYYGAGSVVIESGLVTRLTIAMNTRVGDAAFAFWQKGETYSKGFLEVRGDGGTFSQVLEGSNTLDFRFLIEGRYSYTYYDPLRGVRLSDNFEIDGGQTTPLNIEVPGGGPFTFNAEYAGGIPLPLGMKFKIQTDIKTFEAEIQEDANGNRFAYWEALPEGRWRLFANRSWYHYVEIEHGVQNSYAALDALGTGIPFWVPARFEFFDYHGQPISEFRMRVVEHGTTHGYWQGPFVNGFRSMDLRSGHWDIYFQPLNSPFEVMTTVTVDGQDTMINETVALPEPHATVRFVVRDSQRGFISARVVASTNLTGYNRAFSNEYANPFQELDYLPTSTPVNLTLYQGRSYGVPRSYYELNLVEGYQEWPDVFLETVAPNGEMTVSWINGLPTLEIQADRDASLIEEIRYSSNQYFTYDQASGLWRYPIESFTRLGHNSVRLNYEGIHGASRSVTTSFTWPSAAPVSLVSDPVITALPHTLVIEVDDSDFNIDLAHYQDTGNRSLQINGGVFLGTIVGSSPARIEVPIEQFGYPWRLGNNTIYLQLFDDQGRVAGLSTAVEMDLPSQGTLTFPEFPEDAAGTITMRSPSGVESSVNVAAGEAYRMTGLSFGEWQFRYAYEGFVGYVTHEVERLEPINVSSAHTKPVFELRVRMLDENGGPLANVPVTVRQRTGYSYYRNYEESFWDLPTQVTDSEGYITVADLAETYVQVIAEFDGYQMVADFSDYGSSKPRGSSPLTPEVSLVDRGAGSVLFTVRDNLSEGLPVVADLDVTLNGEAAGTTDIAGQWQSPTYQSGADLEVHLTGLTAQGGEVDETRTVTTRRGVQSIEWLLQPDYFGQLEISLAQGFEDFVGEIAVGEHTVAYPFSGSVTLRLPEGEHSLAIRDQLGQTWRSEQVTIQRNQLTQLELRAPDLTQSHLLNVFVQDENGSAASRSDLYFNSIFVGSTNSDGSFTRRFLPGDYQLMVVHEQGTAKQQLMLVANTTSTISAVVSGFSATSFEGNLMWLTADDYALTLDDQGAVSQWTDLSGRGNAAAQNNPDGRPSLEYNSDLQQSGLRFDGIDDFLSMPEGFRDFNFGLTSFVVVQPDGGNSNARILELGNTGQQRMVYVGQLGETDRFEYGYRRSRFSSPRRAYSDHAFMAHRPNLLTASQVSDRVVLYHNGNTVSEDQIELPAQTLREFNYIGKSQDEELRPFSGTISEIILYNRFLSDVERQEVEIYLADKYRIYHPQANWINDFDSDVQSLIHADQLTFAKTQRLVDLIASQPAVPVAGLSLWLDPAQDAEIGGRENRVANLRDQSIYQHQGTTELASNGEPLGPRLEEDGFGGFNYLDFSDRNAFISFDTFGPELNDGATFFFVMRAQSTGGFFGTTSPLRNTLYSARIQNNGTLYFQSSHALNQRPVGERWQVVAISHKDNIFQTRIQGFQQEEQFSYGSSSISNVAMELGRRYRSNYESAYLDGDIAEVLIYKRKLENTEIRQIESYLASKFQLDIPLSAPVFEPAAGFYDQTQHVHILNPVGVGTIHYTLDGSEPSLTDPIFDPLQPIHVSGQQTIKARIFADGLNPSSIGAATYVVGLNSTQVVKLSENRTLWAPGTTEQDYQNKRLYISGATIEIIDHHQFAELHLINGAVLKHREGELPGVAIQVSGDMVIDAGSAIDVSGLAPIDNAQGGGNYGRNVGSGAGHGGQGGTGIESNTGDVTGGNTYGDALNPNTFGSPGGWSSQTARGLGGGLVNLSIGGTLYLDGRISANGTGGSRTSYRKGGGGSGGSVMVSAQAISGSGYLQANGGFWDYQAPASFLDGGGGGGGRLALQVTNGLGGFPEAHIQAMSGVGGGAQSGSVYVNGVALPEAEDLRDSDGDGLSNTAEVSLGTDPFDSDSDNDLLLDGEELTFNTNPLVADMDDDGLLDGEEILHWQTDPEVVDSDGDTLGDGDEVLTHNTLPALADSDNDGLDDNVELFETETLPRNADTDGDQLADGAEVFVHNTDPHLADTDRGGQLDGVEVLQGTHPLVASDDISDFISLGEQSGQARFPRVKFDHLGNQHYLWVDNIKSSSKLFYQMRDIDGQVLIDRTQVGPEMRRSRYPELEVDSLGRVHILFEHADIHDDSFDHEVYYTMIDTRRHPQDGSSSSDVQLTAVDDVRISQSGGRPEPHGDLVIDSQNRAHLVWQGGNWPDYYLYYTRFEDGVQTVARTPLVTLISSQWYMAPRLVIDSQDHLHLAWWDYVGQIYGTREVYYSMFDGETLEIMIDRSSVSPVDSRNSDQPDIAIADNDEIVMVFQDTRIDDFSSAYEIYMVRFNPYNHAQDGSPANISAIAIHQETPASVLDDRSSIKPAVAIDANGNTLVSYGERYPGQPVITADLMLRVFAEADSSLMYSTALLPHLSLNNEEDILIQGLDVGFGKAALTWMDRGSDQKRAMAKVLDYLEPDPARQPVSFDPPAGLVATGQSIILEHAVAGAQIYYTTDGSWPDQTSTNVASGTAINLSEDSDIRAMALLPDQTWSPAKQARYRIGDVTANTLVIRQNTVYGDAEPLLQDRDVVVNGARLTLSGQHRFNSLTLLNGAELTHQPGVLPGLVLDITSDMTIDPGSQIDVSGRGYAGGDATSIDGYGPGGGTLMGTVAGGGAYGGYTATSPSYGDAFSPVDFGSGGAYQESGSLAGGFGGGTVQLTVAGYLQLDGQILADGAPGLVRFSGGRHSGSGAGGSIQIDAGTLAGDGLIRANGAAGQYFEFADPVGTAGAGGRVALNYDDSQNTWDLDQIEVHNGLSEDVAHGSLALNGFLYDVPVSLRLLVSKQGASNGGDGDGEGEGGEFGGEGGKRRNGKRMMPAGDLLVRLTDEDDQTYQDYADRNGYVGFDGLPLYQSFVVEISEDDGASFQDGGEIFTESAYMEERVVVISAIKLFVSLDDELSDFRDYLEFELYAYGEGNAGKREVFGPARKRPYLEPVNVDHRGSYTIMEFELPECDAYNELYIYLEPFGMEVVETSFYNSCDEGDVYLDFFEADGWEDAIFFPVTEDLQLLDPSIQTTLIEAAWIDGETRREIPMGSDTFEDATGYGSWIREIRNERYGNIGVHYRLGIGTPIECPEGEIGPCFESYSEGISFPNLVEGDPDPFQIWAPLFPEGVVGEHYGNGSGGGG